MQILSLERAAGFFDTPNLASFFETVNWTYPDPVPSYFLPKDAGAKVGLARVIANTFLDRGPALLWITETGIWGSLEHMDLFARYRLSYGERRTIVEAPVHFFESIDDRDAFISILCVGLFFGWNLEIMGQDRALAVTISHDEWIEYRFAPGQESFVPYFEKWFDQTYSMGRAPRPSAGGHNSE